MNVRFPVENFKMLLIILFHWFEEVKNILSDIVAENKSKPNLRPQQKLKHYLIIRKESIFIMYITQSRLFILRSGFIPLLTPVLGLINKLVFSFVCIIYVLLYYTLVCNMENNNNKEHWNSINIQYLTLITSISYINSKLVSLKKNLNMSLIWKQKLMF